MKEEKKPREWTAWILLPEKGMLEIEVDSIAYIASSKKMLLKCGKWNTPIKGKKIVPTKVKIVELLK